MKISKLLKRVTGVSTPLGGISWASPAVSSIAKFTAPIYLTAACNDDFISFLAENDRKIIALNLNLDASVCTGDQYEIAEENRKTFEQVHSCKLNGLAIQLPSHEKKRSYLTFYFCSPHPLVHSSGGTGIFRIPIRGFFETTRTFHGGPSVRFHLKEVMVPIDVQVAVFES